MNRSELQQLKLAWIVAKEANDTHTQVTLLRDHPEGQADLIDFIAAYSATNIDAAETEEQTALFPLTQRATQAALEPVFPPHPLAPNPHQFHAQQAASKGKQSPKKQSFAEAIEKSTMNKDDKGFWLED